MVTRVYGQLNNEAEISFTQISEAEWRAVVPAAPDGEYVVSLWADDDAGNTAYYATMLFIIKAHEVIAMRFMPDYYAIRLKKGRCADGYGALYFRGTPIHLLGSKSP